MPGNLHYCVPIISRGNLLGVISLYVLDSFRGDTDEGAFLSTIMTTLAGLIEKRNMEERIRHMAEHDALTGLPNRLLFKEHLQREILHTKRDETTLAVLFLDLDKFKEVNDTLGHEAGDELLIQDSQRIKSCLRESDTIARMGGDEFTLILSSMVDSEAAGRIARKIIKELRKPFLINDNQCYIGVSVGISLCPENGTDSDTLMRHADIAMYWVKIMVGIAFTISPWKMSNYRFQKELIMIVQSNCLAQCLSTDEEVVRRSFNR